MPVITLPSQPEPGRRARWSGLHNATQSLAIAAAAQAWRGPILVIADSAASAAQIESELRFFAGARADSPPVIPFPDWETLPYDVFSPHQDIVSDRLTALHRLPHLNNGIVVTSINTVLQRLPPPSFLAAHTFVYRTGDRIDPEALRQQLTLAGYHQVDTVYEHGEYAVRGALIDIYPMGARQPFRIDLFDDEIETLRTFDPETQLTIENVTAINLLPAREVPLDKDAIRLFQDQWHQAFDVDHTRCTVYQSIREGVPPQGIEYYLPLFFQETATLFDYLPADCKLFTHPELEPCMEQFWKEVAERYDQNRHDPERPLLPPSRVFVGAGEVFAAMKALPRIELSSDTLESNPARGDYILPTAPLPAVAVDHRSEQPLIELQRFLQTFDGRVLLCAESAGRRESLLELLRDTQPRPQEVADWHAFVGSDVPLAITVYPMDRGLLLTHPSLCLLSEADLFGQQVLQRRRRDRQQRDQGEHIIKSLSELRPGDAVVHIHHGVGRYQGLQTLSVDDQPHEFLTLEYADNAKLYVPVASLHLISRYSGGSDDSAPLHRLGSEQWQKARDKAARQVRDTAAELLEVYAQRAARGGFAFRSPEQDYRVFCADFAFEETEDQQTAIEAVWKDMHSKQPMDRLVCGDVGFGKTEVAMRAAFIAVSSGKQVVVLVPTTLLAQQHFDNFRDRFASWPVQIEVISRFRSGKEQDAVLQRVAEGQVDILIGTHKLINSDIRYADLGLLIIDEEHRFGVRQKEKLKALRTEVDILALTATPIPRSLNMALQGVRDLSIIATPPARRLAVRTFVREREKRVIREAVLREVLRGGQVYYLHNDVKTIQKAAHDLGELVPEARIAVAHGQLRERELEKVMSDFYHQRFNVLVCSTIIETGIDVPTANTIVIERADKFGLAQLHQLRGRVGRSHHQAYAYLLTPNHKAMTDDALKRLEAIQAADHLGSGFTLATHDLEIRGAGELLGDDQSGHIHSIGFTLYMELLKKAVKAIENGTLPDIDRFEDDNVEINLNIPALIPDDYLPDVNNRLIMYKRLASAEREQHLHELQVEMIDRFGLLPEPLKHLVAVTQLRLRAESLGISRIDANAQGARIHFSAKPTVDPLTIVQLVQRHPDRYRLQGATELKLTVAMPRAEQRIREISALLDLLQGEP